MGDVEIPDLFCQWARKNTPINASDASVVQETQLDTSVGVRGDWVWFIHRIEVDYRALLKAMLIGKPNLGTPSFDTAGIISELAFIQQNDLTTTGHSGGFVVQPQVYEPPTPIPYAAPKISVYTKCSADHATYQGKPMVTSIYYTFGPSTPQIQRELLERWALVQ